MTEPVASYEAAGINPMALMREHLDRRRQQPLAPVVFGNLRQRLTDRIEQDVLPALIAARR